MKKFRKSLFGFRKKDVNQYVDHLVKACEEKIAEKDQEIQQIQDQLQETSGKYHALRAQEKSIQEEKERISQTFIKANEASEQIIEQAKVIAKQEIAELENYAEQEREKIVDIKKELKYLKESAKSALSRYEEALTGIMNTQELSENDRNSDAL